MSEARGGCAPGVRRRDDERGIAEGIHESHS